MSFAIGFTLALFLSSVLVPLMVRLAPALGLVDQPDERKVHVNPIPRAGGVAIVLAFFIPVILWPLDFSSHIALFFGAAVIAIFGFLDDRHNLSYQWKFAAQIIAIAIFLAGNVEITKTPFLGFGNELPWLSYPVLALFILGVTNAVNLSDGLDGLAAGSSLLSFAFVAFLSYSSSDYALTMLSVCVMGALTGFLRFNTHPASIFMGDAGSQFLGYMAACLAVLATQAENSAVSPVLVLLIVGLPVLDTLMVIALRLRSGHSPFKPDQRHIHHQLMRSGLFHYQAVAGIYLLSFALMMIAYFVRYQSDFLVLSSYLIFCFLALLGLNRRLKVRPNKDKLLEGGKLERRNTFFRRFAVIYNNGPYLVSSLVAVILVLSVLLGDVEQASWLRLSVLGFGCLIAWSWLNPLATWLNRVLIYIACAGAVFVCERGFILDLPSWHSFRALDVLFLGLAILLAITIRTTRRVHFSLDNQDLLVLLLLAAAPMAAAFSNEVQISGSILRLVVLLYAGEYIVSRATNPRVLRAAVSLAWLVFLGKAWLG